MREIHYSEIAPFLRCRRQWYYRYKLGLVPRVQSERLDIGTAGHKAIERLLFGDTDAAAIKAAVDYLVGKVEGAGVMAPFSVDKAIDIATGVGAAGAVAIRNIGMKSVVMLGNDPLIEQVVKVVVRPGVLVRGTADEVLEFNDGTRLVVDNKFRAAFRPFSTEALNLQMAVYQKLLLMNGVSTDGSMQLQINRDGPKVPKMTAAGGVSRASCATTWEVYSETVREAGLDVGDYLDMKAKLKYRAFDSSVKAYRSLIELDNIWNDEVLPTVDAIVDAYNAPTQRGGRCFIHEVCSSCEMRELCVEDMKGGDTDFVKITRYRHKDDPASSEPPTVIFDEDDGGWDDD